MTSANSIIKTNEKRASFVPLFEFLTKQFWTTILLFTIILFFVLPVPVLMSITESMNSYGNSAERLTRMFAEEWAPVIRLFVVPIVAAFGIIVSCARFSYLKNKVSIDFYHSLPITRTRLYITQLAVSALALAIPYLVDLLLTVLIIAANGLMSAALMMNLITMTYEVFVYTALYYALSTLVGMISGLTAVHLTLTAVAIFIVPALHLVTAAFLNIFNENMWLDWYLSENILKELSPVLRFFIEYSKPLGILESLIMLLFAAGMLIGAWLIYTHRKSERAGTPVVFAPLGEVIKYVLVFIGTLLGGLMFYYIMNDFFWTVFGMACGMILVFMLTNTVIHKTAKAMFRGWKGLCIFGGTTAVIFLLLVSNAFGINSRVPLAINTSKVVVNFGDMADGIELRDYDNINAIREIYDGSTWIHDVKGWESWTVFEFDSLTLEVVFYPRIGFPVAKSVRIYNKNDKIEQFRTILDSEEFREQYAGLLKRCENTNGNASVDGPTYAFTDEGNLLIQSDKQTHFYWGPSYDPYDEQHFDRLGIETIAQDLEHVNFDLFQQPCYGAMKFFPEGINNDFVIPIFEGMEHTFRQLNQEGLSAMITDTFIDNLANAIDRIQIIRIENNDVKDEAAKKQITVKDKKKIREILTSVVCPVRVSGWGEFTFIDNSYYVIIELDKVYYTESSGTYYYSDNGEKIIVENSDSTTPLNAGSRSYESAFFYGKVPQFVIDSLG